MLWQVLAVRTSGRLKVSLAVCRLVQVLASEKGPEGPRSSADRREENPVTDSEETLLTKVTGLVATSTERTIICCGGITFFRP